MSVSRDSFRWQLFGLLRLVASLARRHNRVTTAAAGARCDKGGPPNPLIDRTFDDRVIFIGSGSGSLGSLFNR
jgi:hypothetical protein